MECHILGAATRKVGNTALQNCKLNSMRTQRVFSIVFNLPFFPKIQYEYSPKTKCSRVTLLRLSVVLCRLVFSLTSNSWQLITDAATTQRPTWSWERQTVPPGWSAAACIPRAWTPARRWAQATRHRSYEEWSERQGTESLGQAPYRHIHSHRHRHIQRHIRTNTQSHTETDLITDV